MDETWTIGELAARAATALTADGAAQVSGRVRDLPNERLIRWYTTIGLVDPPLGRRGRNALYGPRHLLQLVAVKRRQAAGHSIAEIQMELAAAPDETLARIAGLPAGGATAPTASAHPAPFESGRPEPSRTRGTTAPRSPEEPEESAAGNAGRAAPPRPAAGSARTAEPTRAPTGSADGEGGHEQTDFWRTRPDVSYSRAAVVSDYGRPLPSVLQGVRLAPGLTVLLDGPTLSGDDLAAIETAARPLLDELHRRGLLTLAESPDSPSADHSRRFQ
ncbi:MerR family transcriptional regulator [Actinomadura formosensis]|uniref:helix-turn-helix domain-containing protein n=1 Tax=Actinomadura formosensis TaxID=60706 RepID=UPI003D91A0A9